MVHYGPNPAMLRPKSFEVGRDLVDLGLVSARLGEAVPDLAPGRANFGQVAFRLVEIGLANAQPDQAWSESGQFRADLVQTWPKPKSGRSGPMSPALGPR